MKKYIYNARKAFNEINEMVTVDPLVALCQTVKLRENIPTSALEELEDIADME